MKSELINVRSDARKESNGCHGTLEKEEWRPVKGYEGLYEVSSFGRVKSLERVSGGDRNVQLQTRIKKPTQNAYGYNVTTLNKNAKGKTFFIHRLVMEAFVPNPDNLPFVNHRNEDKAANYPDNMEWCDCEYNTNYGNCKKKMRSAKRNIMRPVLQLSLSGELLKEYESTIEAARNSGFDRCNITRCCRGKRPSAYGYVWKFKE